MRVGNLRNRITLQPKSEVQDSTGDPVNTWDTANQVEVAGSIKALNGRELIEAQKIESQVLYTIMIRNTSDVSSVDHSWRAVSGGKNYAIHAVIPHDQKGRWLALQCSEGIQDNG